MAEEYLFYENGKLSKLLDQEKQKIARKVANLPPDEIAKIDPEVLAKEIAQKFTLSVPVIHKNQIKKITEKNIQIQTREEAQYQTGKLTVGPPEKTLMIPGKEAIVEIPFSGDARLLNYQPSKFVFTIPKGEIVNDRLRLRVSYQPQEQAFLDQKLKHQLERIDFYLKGIAEEVKDYHQSLPNYIKDQITKRKARNAPGNPKAPKR